MSRRRIKHTKKHGSVSEGTPDATTKKSSQERQTISLEELKLIVARAKDHPLNSEDLSKLDAAVDTLGVLTRELEAKGASILRLRRLIFGASTEKTRNVVGGGKSTEDSETKNGADSEIAKKKTSSDEAKTDAESGDEQTKENGNAAKNEKPKRQGHGRRGAKEYTGAKKCTVDHETLKHGDPCPECEKGKVYRQKEPKVLVRVTGVAPIDATVYEM